MIIWGRAGARCDYLRWRSIFAEAIDLSSLEIYLALVGLSGGSGSGGSHYGVRVIGGKFGVDFTTAQPGPVISGFTLENQTCSALVYAGLQTLSVVGLRVKVGTPMSTPAVVAGCAPTNHMVQTWDGQLFGKGCELPQFAAPSIVQPCQAGNSGALSLVRESLSPPAIRRIRRRVVCPSRLECM